MLDSKFAGGDIETHFGGRAETASAGTVLKSGKLLVAGTSTINGSVADVFAVYNRDGTLSNSFDGDGKLILSAANSKAIGTPLKVFGTSDGGVLVVGTVGLMKLLASGQLDTKFGFTENAKTGFDSYADSATSSVKFVFRDAYLSSDGLLHTLTETTYSGKTYTNIMLFNPLTGEALDNHSFAKVTEQTVFVGNGEGAAFTVNKGFYSEYGFAENFTRRANFGNNGVVDLTGAYQKWINANGPFMLSSGTLDIKGYPELKVEVQQATADGGLQLLGYINATSPKLTQDPQNPGRTLVFITISNAGKVTSVGNTIAANGSTVFDSNPTSTSYTADGTFYTPGGGVFDVTSPKRNAGFTATVADTDGALYAIGSMFTQFPNGGFVIARVLPFSTVPVATGTISGVLFNDDNADGKRQYTESINASRVVYLDTNDNGKLDAGEQSVSTNAMGQYAFSGLVPGNYNVRRVLPSGYQITTPLATKGQSVTITANQTATADIGSTARAIVQGTISFIDKNGANPHPADGQYVFLDLDGDHMQDPNEQVTNANASGFYRFALTPGTYHVSSTPASNYTFADGTRVFDKEVSLKAADLVNVNIVIRTT